MVNVYHGCWAPTSEALDPGIPQSLPSGPIRLLYREVRIENTLQDRQAARIPEMGYRDGSAHQVINS